MPIKLILLSIAAGWKLWKLADSFLDPKGESNFID